METASLDKNNVDASEETEGEAASLQAGSLERNNLILVILGALVSVYWQDRTLTLSFLAGGILSVVNLRMLRLIVGNLTGPERISKVKLVMQVLIKYLGVLGALAFLLLVLHPQPVALLIGLSTVVAAILVEGLLGIFRH